MIVKARGRNIGRIEGVTFTKHTNAEKHMLKKPPAWCIDAEAFDNEILIRCEDMVIYDDNSQKKYRCTVDTFLSHMGTMDRGHGTQYFLELKHWEV